MQWPSFPPQGYPHLLPPLSNQYPQFFSYYLNAWFSCSLRIDYLFNVDTNFETFDDLVNKTVVEASVWFRTNGFLWNDSISQIILFTLG